MHIISDSKEEADENEFKCSKDGLYANERNCSSFIQCTNHQPIVRSCTQGFHFSVKTKQCESECEALCDKTLACKCEWKTCGSKKSCQLPSVTGSCNATLQRFYFDPGPGECKAFVYGGCEGNENNFEYEEDCQKYCGSTVNICKLPRDVGPCKANIPRWWYNYKTKKCEEFSYGGCMGNANRFQSQEQCVQKCVKQAEEEEEAEKESFKCPKNGLYPKKRSCSSFVQCNNSRPVVKDCPKGQHFSFKNQRCEIPCDAHCDRGMACDCHWDTCKPNRSCLLPVRPGSYTDHIPRYYFEKRTGLCKLFIYGGWDGNENNFENKEECQKFCENTIDVCKLQSDVGPCKALVPRWWYNSKTKKCEKFTYGSCLGNANNFRTVEECEERCSKKTPATQGVGKPPFKCVKDGRYPLERYCFWYIQCNGGEGYVGSCPRGLHFNSTTQLCEKPCDARCDKTLACPCKSDTCGKQNCLLLPARGDCIPPHWPRYFFNKRTGYCMPFFYSGCLGNENNFVSKVECEKNCNDSLNICNLPAVSGHCVFHSYRYFFNSTAGKCQIFLYGGCGGTANNFPSLEACESKCLNKSVLEESFSEESSEKVDPEPECDSPPDTERCRANIDRWYYDKKQGKCLKFVYGGCPGNGNNYLTESQCLKHCSKHSEKLTCLEPDGDFPYYLECRKYIACRDGTPKLKDCPSKLSFDFLLRKCVPIDEAECPR